MVDNSAGMEGPQKRLAHAMADLVKIKNRLDLKVAVVTTDMSEAAPSLANGYGTLQGGALVRFANGEQVLSLSKE